MTESRFRCEPLDACECALYERTTDWTIVWCERIDLGVRRD